MFSQWLNDIFTAPCRLALLGRRSCTEEPRSVSRRRIAALPKTLPHNRKEIDLSYNPATNVSSPYLAKLPLELRQQIYTYALGGQVFHVLLTPTRVAHICCSHHTKTDFTRACCISARHLIVPQSVFIPSSNINVALLLSCRQIYRETLPILYSCNTFDIDDLSAFNILGTNIPPLGLSAINSLYVNWCADWPPLEIAETASAIKAPYDDATYLCFWRTLASQMPALKDLCMAIMNVWWVMILKLGDAWVQPVKEVRGLDVFELEILAPSDGSREKEQMGEFAGELKILLCRERI